MQSILPQIRTSAIRGGKAVATISKLTRIIMPALVAFLFVVGAFKAVVTEAAEEKAVADITHQTEAQPVVRESAEHYQQLQGFQPRDRGYHLLIEKSNRKMTMFVSGSEYRTYRIYLGSSPEGHKTRRGDGRTPEGEYYVCRRIENSVYFRSLLISYPSPEDARQGLERGLINHSVLADVINAHQYGGIPPQNTRLGGSICIHGEGGRSRPQEDWTAGCIAVTNKEMAEIFSLVPVGAAVTILP